MASTKDSSACVTRLTRLGNNPCTPIHPKSASTLRIGGEQRRGEKCMQIPRIDRTKPHIRRCITDERFAIALAEALRCPSGPRCPSCDNPKPYRLNIKGVGTITRACERAQGSQHLVGRGRMSVQPVPVRRSKLVGEIDDRIRDREGGLHFQNRLSVVRGVVWLAAPTAKCWLNEKLVLITPEGK